ncbi:odorant receptor 13a-like [Bacillus rossius redtenbacheri]|uniref:odorant receptor 13a-like n=1 Tax=Bacillus rossius redtenbacheri TaxID=93214 RepID=UPI002FDE5CE9
MAGIVRDLGNFDAIINNVVMTKYEWPRCLSAQCADIVTKTNRFARILTLTITFFIFLIFLSWTFSPVFTVVFSGADPTGRRLHPFLAHFFFDYQSSPSYEAVYCFQSVSLLSFCMSASNFDAMFVAFLMQAGAQYRVLTASLGKLREAAEESAYGMDYDKAEGGSVSGPDLSPPGRNTEFQQELLKRHIVQHLRKCIMHHNDIITFIKKLDDVFNPIMLAEILYSMCEIAVSGLQATESQEVALTAYSCEWYHMDPQINAMLRMVIMRAQKPSKITAFHFKVICTDTYGTLLNGAYTYFALLKEIKKGSAT